MHLRQTRLNRRLFEILQTTLSAGMLVRLPYFAAAWLILCGAARPAEPRLPPPANRPIDFVKDVRPIFDSACMSCHGPKQQKSSYRLDRKKDALAGGDVGVAIVPGKSAESALIQRVAGVGEDKPMPPEGKRLSTVQVGVLRAWIDQGAGVKPGVAVGQSDEWGWKAIMPYYCYDLHATILHLLGIDHTRLTVRHNGIDRRLTDVHGEVMREVVS